MTVSLGQRTEETVAIYFAKAQQPAIKEMLPQKAQSLEEALSDYRETLLPSSTSYGRTVWADHRYVGDVWCYCIDLNEEPNAMLSYCIFEDVLWNQGIATRAVALFLEEIRQRFTLRTVGAFTYSDNHASIKVLEKNGFSAVEEFSEDGRKSGYYQLSFH